MIFVLEFYIGWEEAENYADDNDDYLHDEVTPKLQDHRIVNIIVWT